MATVLLVFILFCLIGVLLAFVGFFLALAEDLFQK